MAIRDVNDLCMMIDANIPIIVLETYEESQAKVLLTRVAIKQTRPIKYWSITQGINKQGFGEDVVDDDNLKDPKLILQHIVNDSDPSLYVLCDYHPYLNEQPVHIRLLKDIALNYQTLSHTIVLLSHELNIPKELRRLSAKFSISFPSDAELITIIREEIREFKALNANQFIKPKVEVLRRMVSNLRGLGVSEARRLIRSAILQDGALTETDIPAMNKAKFDLLDMNGVISFEYDTERFSDVGGLAHLKNWVNQRRQAFIEASSGDKPKGLMLLGVQGAGKSLAAKAVAGLWSVPLLRLDMAALYNKYIGESEKNLRVALEQAEMMAPCVLWIDEIEKGINNKGDNDVSFRLLGTLLTWMAEQTSQVFIVSTANDVSELPPELMRKGRLDEVFFVDLPDPFARESIFNIHLKKRHLNPDDFDIPLLAQAAEGFVGSEIEQVIVSGIYSSKSYDAEMSTKLLINEITKTYPISVLMAEKIHHLRQWAKERTVLAG